MASTPLGAHAPHDGTPTPAGRAAAFFDLDRTLITANSGRLWMEHERRRGRLGPHHMALGGWYLGLYHLGIVPIERAFKAALATIEGKEEAWLREDTLAWFDDHVAPHFAPGARGFLDAHRAAGHPLVLLTSSSPYASERAVAAFGLDDFLCTRFEVADGRFTGDVVRPLCYGPGKVTLATEWAEAQGVDLAASFFYTDSTTDRPMLERVGHPRVVQPDPRLRRLAAKRGWPVLDWSRDDPEAHASLLRALVPGGSVG